MRKILSALVASFLFASQAFAATPQLCIAPIGRQFYNPTNANYVGELRAFANVAASATNSSIVAAVTGKKIRVLAVEISPGPTTASTSIFTTVATTTAISATFTPSPSSPFSLPYNPAGWFETLSGEALGVTTGAGSTTGYQVTYIAY